MSGGRPIKRKRQGPGGAPQLDRWRRSPESAEVGRRALRAYLAIKETLPRCGAKKKATGDPCRNLALTNGRCRFHGGKTPAGNAWHKISLPGRSERDLHKFEQKLKKQGRAKAKKARTLALMTPEDRALCQTWHSTHAPTSIADRARRRQDAAARMLVAEVLSPEKPEDLFV